MCGNTCGAFHVFFLLLENAVSKHCWKKKLTQKLKEETKPVPAGNISLKVIHPKWAKFIALQSHKILQIFVWWGRGLSPGHPPQYKVCKILWLFGAIPSLLFEKSLSNVANTLLIQLKAFFPAVLSSCRFLPTGPWKKVKSWKNNKQTIKRGRLYSIPTYPVCVIEQFLAASKISSILCTFPSDPKYFIYHLAQL